MEYKFINKLKAFNKIIDGYFTLKHSFKHQMITTDSSELESAAYDYIDVIEKLYNHPEFWAGDFASDQGSYELHKKRIELMKKIENLCNEFEEPIKMTTLNNPDIFLNGIKINKV